MTTLLPSVHEVAVRPMERADLDGVLDAWEALAANGHEADPRFTAAPDGRRTFRRLLIDHTFGVHHPFPPAWCAVADGRVVGWLHGTPVPGAPVLDLPPTARILDLWVDPAHRRTGVGRRLVDAFVGRARSAGYPWIEVGTLARDARAVAFWKAVGFGDWQVVLLATS